MKKVKEHSYFFDSVSGISAMITFHDGRPVSGDVDLQHDDRRWRIARDGEQWKVPTQWPQRQTVVNILEFMERKEARYA